MVLAEEIVVEKFGDWLAEMAILSCILAAKD